MERDKDLDEHNEQTYKKNNVKASRTNETSL
jgi:hypothetical protein